MGALIKTGRSLGSGLFIIYLKATTTLCLALREGCCIVEELRNAGRIGSGLDILEKDKLSYMGKLFITKDRTVLT
jgi:hypothetical protein